MQLSVVIPIYNEEKNLSVLYKRLKGTIKKLGLKYEIVFVDDGSVDNSLKILKQLYRKDKNIRIICLSRNFGHMSAVEAGIKHATGKRVVLMDADLQDPPELIENLYNTSLKGYEIVYAIKKTRKEGLFKNFLFNNYYKLLNKLANYHMPPNAGTFSIMDRKVIDILVGLNERNKYFSGLRAWAGFNQTGIQYNRPTRTAGSPASLGRLLKLGLDGIFSFSYIPLRLASLLGFIFASTAFILIFIVIIARIFFQAGIVGWASTLSTILLIGGIQLITLGIIGEYIGRIYEEVKQRPNYIISQTLGIKASRQPRK